MDIKQLKLEVMKFIEAMKAEGKTFSFVALIPTYPGIADTSYILQVKGDWIDGVYCGEIFDYMIPKMFEVLDQPTRACINRIGIYNEDDSLPCYYSDLILVNNIDYSPGKQAYS